MTIKRILKSAKLRIPLELPKLPIQLLLMLTTTLTRPGRAQTAVIATPRTSILAKTSEPLKEEGACHGRGGGLLSLLSW